MIIFTIISFIGITLVVDSTVFGLGSEEVLPEHLSIQYYEDQARGIMFCFLYVVANSFSKYVETIYSRITV